MCGNNGTFLENFLSFSFIISKCEEIKKMVVRIWGVCLNSGILIIPPAVSPTTCHSLFLAQTRPACSKGMTTGPLPTEKELAGRPNVETELLFRDANNHLVARCRKQAYVKSYYVQSKCATAACKTY